MLDSLTATQPDGGKPAASESVPELVQRASSGDNEAFAELYSLHRSRVFGVCFQMLKHRENAEDLTQEIFMKLQPRLASFRGDSSFNTWLHRVTVNQVLMYLRKPATRAERTGDEDDSVFQIAEKRSSVRQCTEARIVISEVLPFLANGYREVLLLHDFFGYEHEEIGEMLGISEGTSKSQLFKARNKIQELLEKMPHGRALNSGSRIVEATVDANSKCALPALTYGELIEMVDRADLEEEDPG